MKIQIVRSKTSTSRYSKKVVVYCLIIMTSLLIINAILCWRANQQMDSTSVTAISAFWGTEVFASAWIKSTESKQKALEKSKEQYSTPSSPSSE